MEEPCPLFYSLFLRKFLPLVCFVPSHFKILLCDTHHTSQSKTLSQVDDAENSVITIMACPWRPRVPSLRVSQAVLFLSPLFNVTSFQWLTFCRRQKESGKQDDEAGKKPSKPWAHTGRLPIKDHNNTFLSHVLFQKAATHPWRPGICVPSLGTWWHLHDYHGTCVCYITQPIKDTF